MSLQTKLTIYRVDDPPAGTVVAVADIRHAVKSSQSSVLSSALTNGQAVSTPTGVFKQLILRADTEVAITVTLSDGTSFTLDSTPLLVLTSAFKTATVTYNQPAGSAVTTANVTLIFC